MLNSLQIYLMLTPLGLYFLMIGLMHMMKRPFLISGKRDQALLFAALSGAMAAGPFQLFFPIGASWNYGVWTWLLLLGLYALACLLYLQIQRPSLNLYNIRLTELRPILSTLAAALDPDPRTAGDMIFMPTLGIQFYVEPNPNFHTLSLVAAGPEQDLSGWKTVQKKLRETLKEPHRTFHRRYSVGIFFLTLGFLILTGLHIMVWLDPAEFLKAIPDLLRI